MIDLGANEGFHTFDFVERVGTSGRVHAFEPNPSLWHHFIDNPTIRLWPFAVGDELSMQNFYIPVEQIYHQVGSIVDPRDFIGNVKVNIVSVPQLTLDSVDELLENPISFIKIDVERREFQALSGMKTLLETFKPAIVLENATNEIRNLLDGYGYSLHALVNCDNVNLFANSLAVHRDKASDVARLVPTDEVADEMLTWVEQQYPDDVVR